MFAKRLPVLLLPLLGLLGAAPAAAQTAPVVSVAAIGASSITWSWTVSVGATGYRILSSTGGGNISGDLPQAASSFTLLGVSTNTSATITVEAFNGATSSDSAPSTAFSAAAAPTRTKLLGTLVSQVSLEWESNGNPAGTTYEVSWSTSADTQTVFSTVAVAGASVSATVAALPASRTVAFKVRARNFDGAPTGFDVSVSTTLPALFGQPVISSATFAQGISSITWYWSASTSAVNYQVFNASNGVVSPLLPASQLSFTQTGLLTNTSYQNYVTAYSANASTNSAPFTRFTLASPSVGLTLLGLSSATLNGSNSETELLSWGANGNPAGTVYNVLWWTSLTSTVTFSTAATNAVAGGLFAGGTVYFTVQAQNGDGLKTDFDATLYSGTFAVDQSTFFAVGAQILPSGSAGALSFVLPNGVATLRISSGTFPVQVTITISTPSASTVVPALGQGLSDLPTPIRLEITALDAFGAPQQPRLPIAVSLAYVRTALGGVDPSTLDLARFDALHGVWVPLSTARSGGTLTAVTDHLSLFAVASVPAAGDLSAITVGPNPLRPVVNPGELMTFRNLPAGARLRLFTYAGEKVADFNADASGVAAWNGRNRNGSWVASGVYIVVVEGTGVKRTLRVAVER